MLEELEDDEIQDLIVRQALFLGILGVGVAAGAAIGLTQLQSACIADGILPQPGAEVTEKAMYTQTACWQGAVVMQQIANYTGVVGALFLLGGGIVDRFPGVVQEVLPA